MISEKLIIFFHLLFAIVVIICFGYCFLVTKSLIYLVVLGIALIVDGIRFFHHVKRNHSRKS